jgi:cation:H+ antiporter
MRGQAAMAVGNLIGSSVYNIVFILGLTVVVSPDAIPVESVVLQGVRGPAGSPWSCRSTCR